MLHRLPLLLLLLIPACADDDTPAPDLGTDGPVADMVTDDAIFDGAIPDQPSLTPDGPVIVPDTQSCTPALPSANFALFTQLKTDLATLTGAAARKARVDQFIADVAQSGTFPVRDAKTVVLFYRGTVSGSLSVAASFNGWKAGVDLLQSFPDTDLFYLEQPLGPARQQYKFVTSGGSWFKDPNNPNVEWDGIPAGGPGEFNSVIPPWGAPDPKGRLLWQQVKSPQLQNTRDVFVYLPPAYDQDSCSRYPLLLVNDGNESLTRSHFDQVALDTFKAGKAKPTVIAFVALASQLDRMSEYSCDTADKGPKYTDFLCDTLVPLLDQQLRTIGTADSRGIIGASLGGLISYAGAWWRSDCFHVVGSQSGSFFYKDNMMIKRVQTSPKLPITRAYLDNGKDNLQPTHDLRDALKAKGYVVHHWELANQDHNWAAWHDRFDEALGQMFPP